MSTLDAQPLLSVRGISIRFGGVLAVNGVTFDLMPKEIFTLVGPNGAGKTTVFNIISRIYNPAAGEIHYRAPSGDFLLTQQAPYHVAELGIARTFQNIELFENATVLHNLLIGQHVRRRSSFFQDFLFSGTVRKAEFSIRDKVEEVVELLDLQHYRDLKVSGLPYGVRKVVEVARALCTQPRLLLLDEPSSGLNVEETDDMAFWIRDIRDKLGITVLMVEHDMALVAKVSDRVLAMNQGEVISLGTPAQVQSDPQVIEAYLGSEEFAAEARVAP